MQPCFKQGCILGNVHCGLLLPSAKKQFLWGWKGEWASCIASGHFFSQRGRNECDFSYLFLADKPGSDLARGEVLYVVGKLCSVWWVPIWGDLLYNATGAGWCQVHQILLWILTLWKWCKIISIFHLNFGKPSFTFFPGSSVAKTK